MDLTLQGRQASYGEVQRGTWRVRNQTYHVEGDWIPAGDAGGDLLRFYGRPWPKAPLIRIVGLATLYNTCNPDCATGTVCELSPVGAWHIPGAPQRGVHLVLQH